MRARPVSSTQMVRLLAARFLAELDRRRRVGAAGALTVAVDGAPAAIPAALADAVSGELSSLGAASIRVTSQDFLRSASLRLERGREDPDAFYEDWLDVSALLREVLAPLGPQGNGRYEHPRPSDGRCPRSCGMSARWTRSPSLGWCFASTTLDTRRWSKPEPETHAPVSCAAPRSRFSSACLRSIPPA